MRKLGHLKISNSEKVPQCDGFASQFFYGGGGILTNISGMFSIRL